MSDAVELTVDGTIYGGWQEFAFTRRIDDCAAILSLKVTEKWAGIDARRPIRQGAAYTLSLGGTEKAAGYIDGLATNYDPENHEVNIETRCAMADIIDCAAAVDGPHEFRNLTLAALAQKLCEPYGLTIRAECDTGAAFARFAIQPGETAWAALERAARQRAVLAFGDGRRELIITRAGLSGAASGSLRLGDNIKSASGSFSHAERYSLIVVRSQQESADELDSESELQPEGRVTDEAIARFRPTVIVGEEPGRGQTLGERAAWHKAVARGRGATVSYVVAGWRDEGGDFWMPNTTVHVRDEYMNIDEELLIVAVTHRLTEEEGRETELEVTPREAFDLLAEAEEKSGGEGGGSADAYPDSVWR
jgi:prophage tail gpP-like protein